MPLYQLMVARFNEYWGNVAFIEDLRADPQGLTEIADLWRPDADPDSVWRGFARDRIAQTQGVASDQVTEAQLDADPGVQIMGAMPSGLKAAFQAVVHENFRRGADGRGPTVPITLAWAPGYDYDLRIWDVADSATSVGGITILLTTRYQTDAHPMTRFAL